MITYVNSSNLDKYEILFDRATELLKNFNPNDPDSLSSQWKIVKAKQLNKEVSELTPEELAEFNDYKISSLNEYFAYLSTIANMSEPDLSEEDKSYFLSLPLDEDTFNIDANSRIIAIPASFARNGIGVQSEELAEVLYFTIDRYYDSTDLASDDLSIAIQWEKGSESGLCRNYGRFLTGTQGQQKLVFGWPITTTLTKTPGVINFAVRIYSLDQDGFKYSFMTLPSAVQIKESLKGGGEDKAAFIREADIEDASANIVNRIVNSTGAYDEHSPVPAVPVITKDIHFYTLDDDNKYDEPIAETTHDLDENENINLAVSAKPGDAGILNYAWHKTRFNTTTGEYDWADELVVGDTIIEYVADDGGDSDQQYYKKDGDTYTLITDDYSGQKYIKIARISAEAGESPAGIYYPEVQARLLVNSSATSKDSVEKVTIPGPNFPTIANNEEIIEHVIKENSNAVTITGKAITVDGDNKTYLEAELENSDENNQGEMANSLAPVFNFTQEEDDKTYKINAYATRNKAKVKTPGKITYRVTALPQAFSVGNSIGTQRNASLNMNSFKTADNKATYIIVNGLASNLPYVVDESVSHDACYYAWIDTGLEIEAIEGTVSDTDIVEKTIAYVAEDGAFDALINRIKTLQGESDTELKNLLGDSLIKLGEIDLKTNTVVEGIPNSELADKYKTFDRGDVTSYDLIICLVINALNGRYAAAASTFYLV